MSSGSILNYRIQRFKAGMSIIEIAQQDSVTFHTVYDDLWRHGEIPNTYLIDEFIKAVQRLGLPAPDREYAFVHAAPAHLQQLFLAPKTRKPRGWKTDCAWPWHKVAVEVDGGKWVPRGGRHTNDREKRNAYAVIGWRVLYFDTDMLEDPDACAQIVRLALTAHEQ
jgi:hypothetical protein